MHTYLIQEPPKEFQNIDAADLMKEFDFDKLYPKQTLKA
jgi:hypothetical protein